MAQNHVKATNILQVLIIFLSVKRGENYNNSTPSFWEVHYTLPTRFCLNIMIWLVNYYREYNKYIYFKCVEKDHSMLLVVTVQYWWILKLIFSHNW